MSILSFVRSGRTSSTGSKSVRSVPARGDAHPAVRRACVEVLETRCLMTATNPDLVSQNAAGAVGNNNSPPTSAAEPNFGPKMSSTGRFVAFDSSATNLVSGLTPTADEVYLRDTVSNSTTMVSVDSAGQPMANSYLSDMTPDGRYVLFFNVQGNNTYLYRRDVLTSNTVLVSAERLSTIPAPVAADPTSHKPTFPALISSDGNRVAFVSPDDFVGTNVVDLNGADDIFVRDINAQRNLLVTPGATNTTTAPNTGRFYSISMDASGNLVAFDTDRTGLGLAGQTGNSTALRTVLLRNVSANTTVDVSAGATGTGGGTSAGTSSSPVLSRDGSSLAFISDSAALALGTNTGGTTATVTPQVILAELTTAGTVTSTSVASHSLSGGPSAGSAAGRPALSADGAFVVFWDDGSDLVPNVTNGTNLYRYNFATNLVELVTLNATNAATTNFDPKIAVSDDGRFIAWAVDSTNLDLSVNNYGGAPSTPQRNVYVRDMNVFTVRLLNVSDSDPTSAANAAASDPVMDASGKFVAFVSAASNLNAADTNGKLDVFVCPIPPFPQANVTVLVNAPDVLFGGDTAYYFTVTYNSLIPVKLSTIGDGDVTVSYAPTNFSAPAKLLPGSINLSADGTPVSATYYIVPPGGSWDVTDNSETPNGFTTPARYVVHLNAAQVADVQGDPFPDQDLGSFKVDISLANNDGKAAAVSVPESATTVRVFFIRQDNFPGPVTVNYATVRGTATPGSDYVDQSGTLTFATNGTQFVDITLLPDQLIESDETFRVVLSGATTGGLFTYQQVVVTILDDDSTAPAPSGGTVVVPPNSPIGTVNNPDGSTISLNDGVPTITAPETLPNLHIPVSRANTGTSSVDATFNYTVYSTPEDSAVGGVNYVLDSGTFTIPANSDQSDLIVHLLHDYQVTGDRTFHVVLTNATNGLVLGGTSIQVIEKDVDSSVQFSDSSINTNDDAGVIDLPVTRVGNLTPGSSVHLSFSGSAIAGVDYALVDDGAVDSSGNINFAPGESSKVVHVQLLSRPFNPGSSKSLNANLTSPTALATSDPFSYATVLGSPSTDAITINNLDALGPQVAAVDFKVKNGHIASVVLTFNENVNANAAKKLSNYALFARTRTGQLGQLIRLTSAKYDPSTDTVTLTPAKPLALNQMYQVNVNGSGTITDIAGNRFDGDANAKAGGSFSGLFGYGRSLAYADKDNDLVSFSLKGPGNLKITSLLNAVTVDVLQPDGDNTTLLGSVTKRKGGNGKTTLALLRLRGATFNANESKFEGDIRADV